MQGMAIRLAFELALHLDMSAYVSRGDITRADADLRRTVFWAAYVVDQSVLYARTIWNVETKNSLVSWDSIWADLSAPAWRM
jgi:hypothetical protein